MTSFFLIGRDAGDALADDEGVHVVRALVGLDGLQIQHVAHDRIVIGDAVGSENVAGFASTLERHPDVVALGHGDVLVVEPFSHLSCDPPAAKAIEPW